MSAFFYIRLAEILGLSALGLLYLGLWTRRRPFVLSAIVFALPHAYLGFFRLLAGFEGLPFLSGRELAAISLSFTALVLLFVAAWRLPWGWLWTAGTLLLIHALIIGSHFAHGSWIGFIAGCLVYILILRTLQRHLQKPWQVVVVALLLFVIFLKLFWIDNVASIFREHGLLRSAFAHELKINDEVGATLHITPNDAPRAGEQALLVFEFRTREGTFDVTTCDCRLRIMDNTNIVADQPLAERTSFIFPHPGIYIVETVGPTFDLRYDVRVVEGKVASSAPTRPDHTFHLILAIGLAVFTIVVLIRQKLGYGKR